MSNVLKIVKQYLEGNGFDGLTDGVECGCGSTDLAPCEEGIPLECMPAYRATVRADGTIVTRRGAIIHCADLFEGDDFYYVPEVSDDAREAEGFLALHPDRIAMAQEVCHMYSDGCAKRNGKK